MPVNFNPEHCYLWAIEFENYGPFCGKGEPVAAHLIIDTAGEGEDQCRATACGLRLTIHNHPNGWWRVPRNELPLADPRRIHCGLDHVATEINP